MNKIILFFLLTLFVGGVEAQLVNDGPYLIYKEGKAGLKRLINGEVQSEAINAGRVAIYFAEHPQWNFEVRLKTKLLNEPSVTKMPEKLFVVSDIEGEFEGFRALLVSNRVIDEKYNWTFGKGHLVICGDLFDRGNQVTEELWLLYMLEEKAKAAGGYVHTILGNHDIMNLSGDVRYVQPKYFATAKALGVDYVALYGKDTELGRWLRTKNTIEKIGDNLCAHAGIAPQINALKMPLKEINTKCRPYYDKAKAMIGVDDFSVTQFFESETSLFWYRGYFIEPKAAEAEVDETLRLYGVKRIIVGHTIVPGNVGFYYNGKVLGLDVNQHEGDYQAALFENGKWWKVDDGGERKEMKEQ